MFTGENIMLEKHMYHNLFLGISEQAKSKKIAFIPRGINNIFYQA